MNFKMMGRFVGKILLVEAVFMVPAMLISLWEQEYTAVRAFLWSLAAVMQRFAKPVLCQGRLGLCGYLLDCYESAGMPAFLLFGGNSKFY